MYCTDCVLVKVELLLAWCIFNSFLFFLLNAGDASDIDRYDYHFITLSFGLNLTFSQ